MPACKISYMKFLLVLAQMGAVQVIRE